MDFIKKNKTKKIILIIFIVNVIISIVVLVLPIKKVARANNDNNEKVAFVLEKGEIQFTQYIKTSVSNIKEIMIPIINTIPGQMQNVHVKIYDLNNNELYDGNVEFDSNNIFIIMDDIKNSINDVIKLELKMDFSKSQPYKIDGDNDNYLIYNGKKNDQALINYQVGKVSAKYRVWYPILLSNLMFTLLGTSTKKEKQHNEK